MASAAQHLIRTSELPVSAWRNGRGKTREILSTERRRLSLALVDQAGEFSRYDGFTRVQTVVEGELLVLTVDGREQAIEQYRPFTYDGAAQTTASLPTGPVVCLNAFAAHGTSVSVLVLELSKKRALPLGNDQYGMLLAGHAQLATGEGGGASGDAASLTELDVVVGSGADQTAVTGRGFLAVVTYTAG
ncbi:HutD/Ves family protein [Zhihengliuella flava]|uniref:Environmental stress-induced protein Ves n=1 Tax=Zhihengliuella flava TaxID=1285193 RepID=A0A931D7L1_9MICC|nr:HutD family protein [Zhihengliuella flava]MBG6083887.1 environmental stress-induced protein Ves [Zhihengliuella flava]